MSQINNTQDLTKLATTTQASTTKPKDELGQQDFLKLIVAQMNNQDPTNPQEGQDFLAQLATFSMNDGIQNLQKSFEGLTASLQSSQALQASGLVGRSVEVPAEKGLLTQQGMKGSISVPEGSTNLSIKFYNDKGELQKTIKFNGNQTGEVAFHWDGLNEKGEAVPPGTYSIKADSLIGGTNTQLATFVATNVDSVSIDKAQGLILNLAGVGAMALDKVKKIS